MIGIASPYRSLNIKLSTFCADLQGPTDKQVGTTTMFLLLVIVVTLYMLMLGLCLAAGRSREADEAFEFIEKKATLRQNNLVLPSSAHRKRA